MVRGCEGRVRERRGCEGRGAECRVVRVGKGSRAEEMRGLGRGV